MHPGKINLVVGERGRHLEIAKPGADEEGHQQGAFEPRCEHETEVSEELAAAGEIEEITRSEEHTSELQSLMRISYAVFCLKKKKKKIPEEHKNKKIHKTNDKNTHKHHTMYRKYYNKPTTNHTD